MFTSPKSIPLPDQHSPSARIVDGVLVITLPDAVRPVVWQLELGLSKSSAMEVREQNDGTYLLMLKTPRQDVQDIAPYATRDQAVRALLTISRALEGGTGQLRPANANNPHHLPVVIPGQSAVSGQPASTARQPNTKAWRIGVGILVALVLVYAFTRIPAPSPVASSSNDGDSAPVARTAPAPSGEPLSADDYLNAP